MERNVFRKYQIEHLCGFHEYLTNTDSDELLELLEKYSLNEEHSFELIFYLSEELDSEEEISELFKKYFMQV